MPMTAVANLPNDLTTLLLRGKHTTKSTVVEFKDFNRLLWFNHILRRNDAAAAAVS